MNSDDSFSIFKVINLICEVKIFAKELPISF